MCLLFSILDWLRDCVGAPGGKRGLFLNHYWFLKYSIPTTPSTLSFTTKSFKQFKDSCQVLLSSQQFRYASMRQFKVWYSKTNKFKGDIALQIHHPEPVSAINRMDTIFCCFQIKPYKSQRLDHELMLGDFLAWGQDPTTETSAGGTDLLTVLNEGIFAIQVVRQANYSPLESKRYLSRFSPAQPAVAVPFERLTKTSWSRRTLKSWTRELLLLCYSIPIYIRYYFESC